MKKRIAPSKPPLPKFNSDEAAAAFFETHSVAEVWNQLQKVKSVTPSKGLDRFIQERHANAKRS